MKKITILSLLGLSVFCTLAQESKKIIVPEVVKQAFVKKFPAAQKPGWSLENTTEYEAEFKINKVAMSANFDQNGAWLITETEIRSSQLPVAIQAVLKKEFTDYKVEETEKAETSSGEVFYEVSVEKSKSNLEIRFAPDGKIIRKEEKKEEKD